MKYTCICKKDFSPEHRLQINGAYVGGKHTTTQGTQCSVSIKPNEYTIYQVVGDRTYSYEMDRECFLEFFSMRTFIRNRKLESLGL